MTEDLNLDSFMYENTLHMPMYETIQAMQRMSEITNQEVYEAIQRVVKAFKNKGGTISEEEETFSLEELTESKELTDFLSEMAIKNVC